MTFQNFFVIESFATIILTYFVTINGNKIINPDLHDNFMFYKGSISTLVSIFESVSVSVSVSE